MKNHFKIFKAVLLKNKKTKNLFLQKYSALFSNGGISNHKILVFLLFFIGHSIILSVEVFAQRKVDLSQFSAAYYDSIRVNVYDTTNKNYTIHAYQLTPADKIVIDGKLDEPAWKNAEHKSNFIEKEPYPLIPTSDETEFTVLFDEENIYVGAWCWDSKPDNIVAYLSPRGTYGADNLQLFIDSYNDDRTGYKFVISPTGVQGDELRYDDVKRDNNWNGIWYSEGSCFNLQVSVCILPH